MVRATLERSASLNTGLADVHNQRDDRQIAIDEVGVSDIQFPITVIDRDRKRQHTVARLSLAASLAPELKGTHMSRFVEVLNEYRGDFNVGTLPTILDSLQGRLGADSARVEMTFPYFLERIAPVSGSKALMDYQCTFTGSVSLDTDDFALTVQVPVTALCPCSKEISDYGAHNQRSHVTVTVRSSRSGSGAPLPVYIQDIIEIAELCGSAPLYPLLKRVDERHVTMQAYENPVFVEDIVRGVASRLKNDPRIAQFRVHVVNFESIHTHNAYACLEWSREQDIQ